MQQRDYIERLLEALAGVIASALGVGGQGRFDDAQRELDRAWLSSVGVRRADAEALDDATLRSMLGAKSILAAKLWLAQASLEELRAGGDSVTATALRRRAARFTGS